MRSDRFRTSRELSLGGNQAYLLNQLYTYGQSSRFSGDLTEAFGLYWSGRYDLGGVTELGRDDMRRMFEWFLYDYRTSSDGHRVIDLFIEAQGDSLPPEGREILAAWSESSLGLWRVMDMVDDRLGLLDVLRGDRHEVQNAVLARNAEPGDLLVGRLYELDGALYLSHMTMMLPEEYEEDLVAYVTNAYTLYKETHYQAGWDEFLREYGYIFNAYLLSSKAEALRSLIGPGTRYHDPAIARDKLRVFTNRQMAERQREARQREERRLSQHRTDSGIVLPGALPEESEPSDQDEEVPSRSTILIPGRDF
ncbi:MAG: hypothetical protein A2Y73_06150 [Chloroflexi bacterium RBG_13_56_8]|nr:MAG: hypothetical protein A2Y73_06150 [Chloroflexi bacterium RBG_13_56_8]